MNGLAGTAPHAAFRRALLLGLAALAALLLTLALLPARHQPPSPPLPNPNGYDDFLKAATLLTGDILNAPSLGHDDLQALLATNAQALALARLGLSRGCALTNLYGSMSNLADLKHLGLLLA
jgi:hypothetical protein